MLFPPSFIERLRSYFQLSELIGAHVRLTRKGKEYGGLCPFHNEKTPSFTVNNEKNFFHCFGCGAHGDAIGFTMKFERLSYREAVESLARKAGLDLPTITPEVMQQMEREKSLYDALEEAAAWFARELNGERGMYARNYLRERGLSEETLAQFRVGLAPESREGLKKHLLQKGFTELQLVEAGMLIQPESGVTYDRFRGRIMFPIRDTNGRVIAFGGRLFGDQATDKTLPKYLNSPETPLFKKGETLFNLDQAGKNARELQQIIVVEGYMDAVAMVQAGIPNAVANLGTAVTEHHLRKLWNYADEPIICLDGDAAGLRAMGRVLELALPLLKPGKGLRFTMLPTGEDPDSLIKAQGVEALKVKLAQADPLHEALWQAVSSQFSAANPTARSALQKYIEDLTRKIQDTTVASNYRRFFKDKLWQHGRKPSHNNLQPQSTKRSKAVETMAGASAETPLQAISRQLLKMLITEPKLLGDYTVEKCLDRMETFNPALDQLRSALQEVAHTHEEWSGQKLLEHLGSKGFTHLVNALLKDATWLMPAAQADSLDEIKMLWMKIWGGYEDAVLETEYMQMEQELKKSGHNSEVILHRILALQKELKERKAKRTLEFMED